MLTLHHLESSRSQRILWLLEELGVDYHLEIHQRNPKTKLAPKAMQDIHPLGKSPILTDGDDVVVESAVIIEYLIEKYGNGRFEAPSSTADRRRYSYWMHAAEGSIMPLMVAKLLFTATTRAPVPFFIRPLTKVVAEQIGKAYLDPSLKLQLENMERELAKSTWFAGEELTGADFQMLYPCQAAVARSEVASQLPKVQAFVERAEARPAYQRALAKGGKYEFVL